MIAEVHTLYETNARWISDMMRQAAENIALETDEHDRTKAVVAVQVLKSGEIQVYGWGDTDDLQAIGALQAGMHEVLSIRRGDGE